MGRVLGRHQGDRVGQRGPLEGLQYRWWRHGFPVVRAVLRRRRAVSTAIDATAGGAAEVAAILWKGGERRWSRRRAPKPVI